MPEFAVAEDKHDLWTRTLWEAFSYLYWCTAGLTPDDRVIKLIHELDEAIASSDAHSVWKQWAQRSC